MFPSFGGSVIRPCIPLRVGFRWRLYIKNENNHALGRQRGRCGVGYRELPVGFGCRQSRCLLDQCSEFIKTVQNGSFVFVSEPVRSFVYGSSGPRGSAFKVS